MIRRVALKAIGLTAVGCGIERRVQNMSLDRSVQTVTGPVSPEDLGVVLTHEHVMVDFIGADQVSADRYDPEEVFGKALPFLKQVRALGCRTLVECTPMYLGRDPELLRRLSKASDLLIITNTGMYKAPYLPKYAFDQSAEQLASSWIAEAKEGIDGTGIRPGLTKIAVNPEAELIPVQKKIVRAAALTHLETGLSIAAHTGKGPGLEVLDVLEGEGVAPEAYIWVHAQGQPDQKICFEAARRGAWLSYDGVSPGEGEIPTAIERQVLRALEAGLEDRLLVSHDAGWYNVGEPGGGNYSPYDAVFKRFLPALKAAGVGEGIGQKLLIENARKVLMPKVKEMESAK